MSQKTETVEKPAEKTTEDRKFWHVFCMNCNYGREIAVSMCRAKSMPSANLVGFETPGDVCVVCDELCQKPCEGCGL